MLFTTLKEQTNWKSGFKKETWKKDSERVFFLQKISEGADIKQMNRDKEAELSPSLLPS